MQSEKDCNALNVWFAIEGIIIIVRVRAGLVGSRLC